MYTLDGHILQQIQNNPYLGLQISEDLKWTTHITNVAKKANSTLGFHILLQDCVVLFSLDVSVKETVISEQSNA
jgi:hypothetical protein